jgi:hypothetical protein
MKKMKYKVIANVNLFASPHSWAKGLDYEVTEKEDYFTLTSNEGQVNYKNSVKTDVLVNFKPVNQGSGTLQ